MGERFLKWLEVNLLFRGLKPTGWRYPFAINPEQEMKHLCLINTLTPYRAVLACLFFTLTLGTEAKCQSGDGTGGLKNIPVYVGGMAFNEGNNDGFDQRQIVSWESKNLRITGKGRVAGTFRTHYAGPVTADALIKDVLFFRVDAVYIWPRQGDRMNQALSKVIPVVALRSTTRLATFVLRGAFRIPQLTKETDGGMPLKEIQLNFTWVRVYRKGRGLAFHIFPGDARGYYPDIRDTPEVRIDQPAKRLRGRFGYYELLQGSPFETNDFDYPRWIKKRLN